MRRPEFRPFYEKLIALRRAHPALQQGAVEWTEGADPDRVLRFERRQGEERFTVAINCSNRPAGELKAWGALVKGGAGEKVLELP